MTFSGASRQAAGTQKSTAVDSTGQIIDKVVFKLIYSRLRGVNDTAHCAQSKKFFTILTPWD